MKDIDVSVPSRGLGGFLHWTYDLILWNKSVSGPSRGLGGFLRQLRWSIVGLVWDVSVPSRGMGGFLHKI